MKKFSFPLDIHQSKMLFLPIRSREDVIVLWMNAIKVMSAYARPCDENVIGDVELVVDKMNRLIISSSGKVFSVNFPFSAKNIQREIFEFYTKTGWVVDNRVSSMVVSLMEGSRILEGVALWDFADPIYENVEDVPYMWDVIRELLVVEDGYLRYDEDEDNCNGHLHPLHHLDVFYSNASTFKMGLRKGYLKEDLVDLLNTQTFCHYVSRVD